MLNRQGPAGVHSFRYYIVGRLILGVAVALLLRSFGAPPEAPHFVIAALALTSLEGLRALRGRSKISISVPGILLSDFLIETYVVLQTGAHGSPFLLLYGFTVLFGGLLLALRGGVVFGALAALASSWVVWLLPAPESGAVAPLTPVPAARLGLQALFFIALGAASGSLTALGRRRTREWEETSSRLEQTELEAETILGNLPWGVLTLDAGGRIRHVNAAARTLFGLETSADQHLVGLDDLNRVGAGPLAELARRVLSCGHDMRSGEIRLPRRTDGEGEGRPLEAVAAPIRGVSSEVRGVVLLFQDLSERKKLEAQARRQDRLAALGHFSAGLAHEIRNSLKPITGSAELLASLNLPEEAIPLKDLLLRESEALESFLEAYLDYARDKDLQIGAVDIDALIREELQALRCHPAWHPGIRWEVRSLIAPQMRHEVDGDQFRRALRNLLINAIEATQSGVIRVVLSNGASSGVQIRIRDWGCGMDPNTIDNLFTPLFTTKARGTGLGLCYARRVVERHGGSLSVISRPGKGTLITVDLPPAHLRANAA